MGITPSPHPPIPPMQIKSRVGKSALPLVILSTYLLNVQLRATRQGSTTHYLSHSECTRLDVGRDILGFTSSRDADPWCARQPSLI